jgi:hypothetical protein
MAGEGSRTGGVPERSSRRVTGIGFGMPWRVTACLVGPWWMTEPGSSQVQRGASRKRFMQVGTQTSSLIVSRRRR